MNTRPRGSLMLIAWSVIGVSANALGAFAPSLGGAAPALAAAGLLHCTIGFWHDGGRRITVPGIYFFAAGLFIYFPALSLAFHEASFRHGPAATVTALNVCYFAQVLMYSVAWEPREGATDELVQVSTSSRTASWGTWWSVALVTLGTIASAFGTMKSLGGTGEGVFNLANGAAFSGVVLLSVSLFGGARRVSPLGYAAVAASFFAYVTFVFTGFGRLQIGALGLAIAVILAPHWRGRRLKAAVLLAIAPTLAYLALSRVEFTGGLNPNQAADVTGLESVISPFERFAELLHMASQGSISYTYGQSFFASLVALVPRSLWPGKPVGFGAELATLFDPWLVGVGHSELALLFGEWLFAFGPLGLVAMVPVTGYVLKKLDRVLLLAQSRGLNDRRDLLAVSTGVVLCSSVVDLLWGGTFTYVARVGPRLVVILALFMLTVWKEPRLHKRTSHVAASWQDRTEHATVVHRADRAEPHTQPRPKAAGGPSART